ncbi:MAG: heme exporter protein CcmD [Pseudomonadota bacterium]
MRESLDHWPYILGAYGVGVSALIVLVVLSWLAMKRAEKRRDEVKRR